MLIPGRKDEGFTLVELLVVMVLLGVVGSVVMTGLIRGLDSARQTSARTHAIHELEISLQRVTRELRAADPMFITETGFYGRRLAAEVVRNRQVRVVSYVVADTTDGSGEYQLLQESKIYDLPDDPGVDFDTVVPIETDTTLVTRLDNPGGQVFSYFRSDGGDINCTGTSAVCRQSHGNAAQLLIQLERSLDDGPPIRVETLVNVRSTRYGSSF